MVRTEINNFRQVYKYMENMDPENSGDVFHIIDIVRRRKEHPDLRKNRVIVKTYIINSIKALQAREEEIIELCSTLRARAYFSVNKFSFKRTAFNMLSKTADRLKHGAHIGLQGIYSSSAMESISGDRKWMLDFDHNLGEENEHFWELSTIKEAIDSIQKRLSRGVQLDPQYFPSPNGYHVIVNPFIRNDVSEHLHSLNVEVHRNNFIIIYSNT